MNNLIFSERLRLEKKIIEEIDALAIDHTIFSAVVILSSNGLLNEEECKKYIGDTKL